MATKPTTKTIKSPTPRKKLRSSKLLLLFAAVVAISLILTKISAGVISSSPTVTLTDSGFTPASVRVALGESVVWVNRDTKAHWPASDVHPTHNLYPSDKAGCIGSTFDACRGLNPGETFTFTFNKTGVWGVHDHLSPRLTMQVEVIPKETSILTLLVEVKNHLLSQPLKLPSIDEFRKLDNQRQESAIKQLTVSDPKLAWNFLKDVFSVNGQTVGNPHTFAHIIGNALYERFGSKGILNCDESFSFGCFHGVTEEMLLKAGLNGIAKIQSECLSTFAQSKLNDLASCIHGIGHGLLAWESLDINKALLDCDLLDPNYREYCYDGVFMENSISGLKFKADPNDPWKFCSAFPVSYHRACGRYLLPTFSSLGWNFSQIASSCITAPTQLLKESCLSSIGFSAAQQSQGNAGRIMEICKLINDEDGRAQCLTYAATEVKFQRYQNWETVSKAICENLPDLWKTRCFEQINAI